jgi:hypothetical protein
LHAEDVGWPPKKSDKTINAESNKRIDLSAEFAAIGAEDNTPALAVAA